MQESATSVFDAIEASFITPDQTEKLLQGRKGVTLLIIIAAVYCSAQVILVWFANFLIPANSWAEASVTAYLWENNSPGSVWFEVFIAGLGIAVYILLGLI